MAGALKVWNAATSTWDYVGTGTLLRATRVTSAASSASPTPNVDTTDFFILTAQSEGATFGIPSGSPANGQKLLIRINDDGTAQTLAWNEIYSADNLPSTTTPSETIYLDCIYNADAEKWDVSVKGSETGGTGGYNFLETLPTSDITTSLATTTITGKTMRCSGTGTQEPTVTVNGSPVTVTQTAGDLNIYTFLVSASLSVGANTYTIVSNNGTTLTKTLVITRSAVAPSCAISHAVFFKAGTFTITLTTDYELTVAPTLDASIGDLSTFSGSGKIWTASLTITAENGSGTFSNAVMVGAGGTGTTINSGASYTVDTVAPVIGAAVFSRTLWNYENGSMSCTVAMGESTTGFTGYISLVAFGLSSSYLLSPSGNNMVATFTPSRVNAGPEHGTNIRVSDRCGNVATPKSDTDNQLQVVAYRLALQNVTFPAYSAISNALSGSLSFTTDANSHVSWGSGQTNAGTLVFTTDYVIDTNNKVHLDETKWADTIAANALGLLNVDVYED